MKLVKFTLLFLIVALGGCAATEFSSLELMQNQQVRSLAMACYHNQEGFRLVYGGGEVWRACLVQAEHKVYGLPVANSQ